MMRGRAAIYGVIVVCGAARSFLLPARNALIAEIVPRSLYSASVAWRTGVLARRSAAMIARGARCGWNASVCKRWRSGWA